MLEFSSELMRNGEILDGRKIGELVEAIIKKLSEANLSYDEAQAILNNTKAALGERCVIKVGKEGEIRPLEHTTLENASTKDLVAELEKREGVEKRWLEPDKETIPQVSSPTILLIITD